MAKGTVNWRRLVRDLPKDDYNNLLRILFDMRQDGTEREQQAAHRLIPKALKHRKVDV